MEEPPEATPGTRPQPRQRAEVKPGQKGWWLALGARGRVEPGSWGTHHREAAGLAKKAHGPTPQEVHAAMPGVGAPAAAYSQPGRPSAPFTHPHQATLQTHPQSSLQQTSKVST